MNDISPRPYSFNLTLAPQTPPAAEPGPPSALPLPPPIPKPTSDERAVKSWRLKSIQWGWGLPALLAGFAVCAWNIRFAVSWFHGVEVVGVSIAALTFTAAIISGRLVILYLAERRVELVAPVRLMWRGAILFAAIGAGASIWLSHGPASMPQSLASMERDLAGLYRSSSEAPPGFHDPHYNIVERSRARADRIMRLELEIDRARWSQGTELAPAVMMAREAAMAIGASGVYALLLLFASYGLATCVETSVALTEPKPVAAPPQILEPMPIGAPALIGRAERPLFQMADDVVEEPLRWLWPDVIEEGELAVLGGAPGAGKSTIITDMAAVTSSGRKWPDGSAGKLGSCILFELEDRRERVTKPRLLAARANMGNIAFGERIDLSRDIEQLDNQARAMAARGMPPLRLVTISPMIRFFGDKTVTNRNAVRTLIEPLTNWAQARDVAIVGVTHLKSGGANDDYVGSKAFYEASRASWSAIVNDADPEPDERKKQRILYPAKVSHAPEEERYYRLETVQMPGGLKAARVKWEAESSGKCGDDLGKLQGIVEIDETYVGGIEKNKHEHKKLKAGRGTVGKVAVLGLRERGGKTLAMPIKSTDAQTIQDVIIQRVEVKSTLHTDEAAVYVGMGGLFFDHASVNHSAGEFSRDGVTTNSIESVFAVMKRGVMGVYHHVTPKHLGRYVDEFTFRLNQGHVKHHTLARLASFVDGAAGKRLTYKALIA